MQDWQSLDEAIQLGLIRSRLRAEGKATLNVREGMPASDLLRSAFLRAYAHEDLGLTKTYSYPVLPDRSGVSDQGVRAAQCQFAKGGAGLRTAHGGCRGAV